METIKKEKQTNKQKTISTNWFQCSAVRRQVHLLAATKSFRRGTTAKLTLLTHSLLRSYDLSGDLFQGNNKKKVQNSRLSLFFFFFWVCLIGWFSEFHHHKTSTVRSSEQWRCNRRDAVFSLQRHLWQGDWAKAFLVGGVVRKPGLDLTNVGSPHHFTTCFLLDLRCCLN